MSDSNSEDARCGFQTFELERLPADILLVLDRSGSMDDHELTGPQGTKVTRWVAATQALIPAIQATTSSIWWGLKTYPDGSTECKVVPGVNEPATQGGGTAVVDAIKKTTPKGNGTPTASAIKAATAYLASTPSTNPKYLLLATDGEPNCHNNNPDDTVEAVADAHAAGIPTFVVGIATGMSNTLNRLAVAGGRPRGSTDSDAGVEAGTRSSTRYYSVNSGQDLVEALEAITGQVVSCRFPLKTPPPAPDFVDVTIGGKSVDRSRTDGWEYVDQAHSAIEVYGKACDAIKETADSTSSVDIVFGCPGVPPPRLR